MMETLLGLLALTFVFTGAVPADPTEPAVQSIVDTAAPARDSPLLAYLPSVITFLEKEPLFLEWFTEREVMFVFPSFLEDYVLHVSASDPSVGSLADDGWTNLSRTINPPAILSEDLFLNLTILDAFADTELTLDQTSSNPKGSHKGEKEVPLNNETMGNTDEKENRKMESKGSSMIDGKSMLNDGMLLRRLKTLNPSDVSPLASNFTLIGDRFGKMTLSFELYLEVDGELVLDPEMTALAKDIDVLNIRIPNGFDMAFGTIMLVFGALVTGIMGCELEWAPVKAILRRPFGLVIGFCSQFIIMPVTAFLMCIVFKLPPEHAIGIILAACSPGGGLSNMTSVAIDANLLLSISMTFFSTIIALGMMPLNLFMYSRRFQDDDSFPIPFMKIIMGLLMMIGPLTAGCILRHFKKAWALKLVKLLKPVSFIVIIFALAGGIYTIRFVFTYIVVDMIVCSFSIPYVAFVLGGSAALICRRDFKEVKTIAIETAIQNVGIGAGIVRLVYPQPDADIITCTILWTLMGQSCMIFTVIGIYMLYKKVIKGRCDGRKKLENVEENEEVDGVDSKRSSADCAEMMPLTENDEDHKANGTVHAHLTRMTKAPPHTTDMVNGAYKFWGYRPLVDETTKNGDTTGGNRSVPGLFVTFPPGGAGMTATQLWAPPIVGPNGDVWIPNPELFKSAPESTV
ncbi:sodium/bile acid cotransporter 5-like [Asterias amurensis]|uniref:sodium/bile acid cotransporter 5-like n=1 Tax=Asterias amurensis TaxID=7602 RepID=UPI003AB2AFC9